MPQRGGVSVSSWRATSSGVGQFGFRIGSTSGASCLTGCPRSRISSAMGASFSDRFLDCRCTLLVPGTHAVVQVRRTHVTLCCCRPTPASIADPECASAMRRLLLQYSASPLVLQKVTRRPVAATERIGQRTPTTSNVTFDGFAIGGTCRWMSQRPHDVRAGSLAVCSMTAHTSKSAPLLRSACGASRSSTMVHWSSQVTALTC